MNNPKPFTRPQCPSCGFTVFNRRYPKCERCQATLPAGVVYGAQELGELKRRDAEEDAAEAKARNRSWSDHNVPYVYGGSYDGASSGGCDFGGSSDAGSCSGGD